MLKTKVQQNQRPKVLLKTKAQQNQRPKVLSKIKIQQNQRPKVLLKTKRQQNQRPKVLKTHKTKSDLSEHARPLPWRGKELCWKMLTSEHLQRNNIFFDYFYFFNTYLTFSVNFRLPKDKFAKKKLLQV